MSGSTVYICGVDFGEGLAADRPDFPADVSHLWHGCFAIADQHDGGSVDRRASIATGRSLCAPRYAGHGVDFYRGIFVRDVAAGAGDVPLGLQRQAGQRQWIDSAGFCAVMVYDRAAI